MQEHNLTEYKYFLRITRLYHICCCWKKVIMEDLKENVMNNMENNQEINNRELTATNAMTTTRELPQRIEIEDNEEDSK